MVKKAIMESLLFGVTKQKRSQWPAKKLAVVHPLKLKVQALLAASMQVKVYIGRSNHSDGSLMLQLKALRDSR